MPSKNYCIEIIAVGILLSNMAEEENNCTSRLFAHYYYCFYSTVLCRSLLDCLLSLAAVALHITLNFYFIFTFILTAQFFDFCNFFQCVCSSSTALFWFMTNTAGSSVDIAMQLRSSSSPSSLTLTSQSEGRGRRRSCTRGNAASHLFKRSNLCISPRHIFYFFLISLNNPLIGIDYTNSWA